MTCEACLDHWPRLDVEKANGDIVLLLSFKKSNKPQLISMLSILGNECNSMKIILPQVSKYLRSVNDGQTEYCYVPASLRVLNVSGLLSIFQNFYQQKDNAVSKTCTQRHQQADYHSSESWCPSSI